MQPEETFARGGAETDVRRVEALRARYLNAQLAGDRREALRVALDDGVDAGIAAPRIVLEIIQPAQHEIGRLWQENRISVAQEHLATAISQLVLAHLYPRLPREARRGKSALLACVEGELHAMGARVTADFLEMEGYDVHYLGASVPTDSLVEMVTEQRPDLLALSVSIPTHLGALREAVDRVCDATGGELPILLGGRALAAVEGTDWGSGKVVSCSCVDEMLGEAARLTKGEGSTEPGGGR